MPCLCKEILLLGAKIESMGQLGKTMSFKRFGWRGAQIDSNHCGAGEGAE